MPNRVLRMPILLLLASLAPLSGYAKQDPLPVTEPRRFEIVASKFKFAPETIEVTEGERVVLTMRSADGVHGLGIKQFKVKRRIPKGGESVTVEFVADKAGTFRFICSEYCGGGHSRMKGSLVVHPRAK